MGFASIRINVITATCRESPVTIYNNAKFATFYEILEVITILTTASLNPMLNQMIPAPASAKIALMWHHPYIFSDQIFLLTSNLSPDFVSATNPALTAVKLNLGLCNDEHISLIQSNKHGENETLIFLSTSQGNNTLF
jgi:hypothetical protein